MGERLNKNQKEAMDGVRDGNIFFCSGGYVRRTTLGHFVDVPTRTINSLVLRGLICPDVNATFSIDGVHLTPMSVLDET